MCEEQSLVAGQCIQRFALDAGLLSALAGTRGGRAAQQGDVTIAEGAESVVQLAEFRILISPGGIDAPGPRVLGGQTSDYVLGREQEQVERSEQRGVTPERVDPGEGTIRPTEVDRPLRETPLRPTVSIQLLERHRQRDRSVVLER